ncbi:efflux RND transporter periplasmic adaptor subunit [Endozoicomonas lisbonensis]|uniref:Membrane fusion protein (Multidrug efflux system) n=1 Tax=Endozoicomonas lisbonensis TaxID=3120522 RepID=A0ABV2SC99_9GAMM
MYKSVKIAVSMLATVFACSLPVTAHAKRASGPVPSVTATPVVIQPVERNLSSLGTLRANQSIDIATQIGGRVTALNFDDGIAVEQGDILLTLDNKEQAARVQEAEINLKDEDRQLDSMIQLFEKRAVSRDELAAQEARVERARANLESQTANLEYYTLTAPFNGVLGFNELSTGAMISAGQNITTLDDLSSMKLYFDLPENTFSEISTGTIIHATTDAWPGLLFSGEIDSINPRIDPLNLTFSARATLTNADKHLRPGMLMRLNVARPTLESLVIPARSVLFDGNDQYVYLLDAEGIPQQRFIETGVILESKITVISGLEEGDSIVDQGVVKVTAGRPVKVLNTEVAENSEPAGDARS